MAPEENTLINMTRDDFYKLAVDVVGKALEDKILEGKEAGDKALKDVGETGIINALMTKHEQTRVFEANKAARLGRAIRCAMVGRTQSKDAAIAMAKQESDPMVLKLIQSSNFSSGGSLLADGFMEEVIEYLRAKTVVRSLGAGTIELINDTMTIPYIQTGSTTGYVGEGAATRATSLATGQLSLSAKKILALVPISNDWLRAEGAASLGGSRMVGEDLARSLSVTEDQAFLRGTGAAGEPKGMRYWADAANIVAQSGTTVVAATYDLLRLQYLQKAQNVIIENGAYIFSPRTWLATISARDGNGNLVWGPEMSSGTLFGQQWADTTSIPDNLGSGSDSEVIFASMAYTMIAESMDMTLDVIENATYVDSGGTVVSGVSQDESAVRIIAKHDFGCRHRGKEISVLTGVTWTQLT